MTKFITLFIGLSLALVIGVQAAKEDPKNKQKSKPAQNQVAPKQVAPKQMAPKQMAPKQMAPKQMAPKQMAPKQHPVANPQVQNVQRQHKGPAVQNNAKVHGNHVSKQQANTLPAVQKNKPNKAPTVQANTSNQLPTAKLNKKSAKTLNKAQTVQANTSSQLPAAQLNKKNVKTFRPQHQNFHAQPKSAVASAQFNQNYRISAAQNWNGTNYQVFRSYRPQWHDQGWWRSHYTTLSLIAGGWYFWDGGYWYPAWGYDDSAAYYPYDGPIYSGPRARPFDQVVADVQSALQEQGYYRGEVDGLLGPLTREALAEYQRAQGLYATETIDQPTLESLGMG